MALCMVSLPQTSQGGGALTHLQFQSIWKTYKSKIQPVSHSLQKKKNVCSKLQQTDPVTRPAKFEAKKIF